MIEIKHRHNGLVIHTVEADTLRGAYLRGAYLRGANLSRSDLRGAYLRGSDLRFSDLRGSNLRGSDLCGSDLCGCDLSRCDLRACDLSGSNLRDADLRDADLRGSDLSGSNLRRSDLRGAYLNWESHTLIAELLFRDAEGDIPKRMIAGLVAVSRDWCWEKFLAVPTDLREWALDTLARGVVEGACAPSALAERAWRVRHSAETVGATSEQEALHA